MRVLEVSPEELAAARWMDVVDIRTDEERDLVGFIPGSVRVPPDRIDVEWLREWGSSCAVLVCTTGHRAERIVEDWPAGNHSTLGWLRGGVLRWQELGLPIVTDLVEVNGFEVADASTPDALVSLLRSCFVAEVIEGAMQHDDAIDPIEVFDAALDAAGIVDRACEPDDLPALIDHLAAAHRRLGGPMGRIAQNVGAMRMLARRIRDGA
ncbi:MAG: hypothetical protein KC731_04515 [Myxococcales bacterium]|nr:hypothetical protein [Myxococcales bacterium]